MKKNEPIIIRYHAPCLMKRQSVCEFLGVTEEELTVLRDSDVRFPQPVQPSGLGARWLSHEIEMYLEDLKAKDREMRKHLDRVRRRVKPTGFPAVLEPVSHKVAEYAYCRRFACVYFLISGGEIVYVGQSIYLPARIATHASEEKKQFDRVLYMPVDQSLLNETEQHYIQLLRPVYNCQAVDRSNGQQQAEISSGTDDPGSGLGVGQC